MYDRNKVRALNDAFRLALGRIVATRGLADHPNLGEILNLVRTYSDFTEDNDPYGEHDFGSLNYDGNEIFWKIDYHNKSLNMGSPDPADPALTSRVLTVMLASEY